MSNKLMTNSEISDMKILLTTNSMKQSKTSSGYQ